MIHLYNNRFTFLALFLFTLLSCISLNPAKAEKISLLTTKQPKEEKQKVIKATFKVKADDKLSISNKYGNVSFITHDKDELSIQVTILAWAKNANEAQKIIDRITIDQENDGGQVRFETQIEESRGGYSRSNKEGFEINYEVRVPKNFNLDIENKFGSVTLGDLNGTLNLDLKHGNCNANKLTGKRHTIAIAFGNFAANEIGSADLEVAHGNLTVNKSTADLKIDSKHSNIRIEEANNLEIQASYGTMRIGTVAKIVGENKFGQIEIQKVTKSAFLELKHGNCQIAQISKGFDKIEIENSFGSIELRFDVDAKFQFDAKTQNGSIKNAMPNTTIQRQEESNTERILEGKTNGGGNAKVIVTNQFGSIRLEER